MERITTRPTGKGTPPGEKFPVKNAKKFYLLIEKKKLFLKGVFFEKEGEKEFQHRDHEKGA